MANPTPNQQKYLFDLLTRDQGGNHQLLIYYLKLVTNNQPLKLEIPGLAKTESTLTLTPEEVWTEINAWKDQNEVSLPMGDQGSRKIKAARLLNYLEVIQSNTREAATSFQAILDSARTNPFEGITPANQSQEVVKKTVDIRKLQLEIYNKQIIGQLATQLEQTAYLKRFAGDRQTQIVLAGLLAANAANLRSQAVPKLEVAEEITKLVQLNASRTKSLNNAARLAYANVVQEKELDEVIKTINTYVEKNFDSDTDFINKNKAFASQGHLLTVADIPSIVDMVASGAPANTKRDLSYALQKTIISSTRDSYTSGEELLTQAFAAANLPKQEANNLLAIAPLLEEIRTTELHNLVSGGVQESDPRIQSTLNVASDAGTSSHIPWLNSTDLQAKTAELQLKYDTQNLTKSLQQELARGKNADLGKISEITRHLSNESQFKTYHQAVDNSISLYWREKFGKARGTLATTRNTFDRFSRKIDKKIADVHDFVHAPIYYLSDTFEKLREKNVLWNILTPREFLAEKLTQGQIWVAEKILNWSTKAASSGRWYAGMFRQVSEFTGGFIHSYGDWSSASFSFVQKKWGNVLEWGAQKAGYTGWQGVKASIGTKLWSGFGKLAPGIAEKMANGGFGKLVASLIAGELTAGTSLLIQAGLMVVWEAGKGLWKFATDSRVREKFFDRLPAILAGISMFVAAAPAAIVASLISAGSALLGAIGAIISSLFATIFAPALITVGSVLLAYFLFFQMFNTTIQLDSGFSQTLVNIVCSLTGSEAPDKSTHPRLAAGKCVYELLTKFGINPLTKSNASGPAFESFKAALGNAAAASEAARSAITYLVFQCAGFDMVVDIMTGGVGQFTDAKNLDTIPPPGFTYSSGVGSCARGDFFVDKNGDWGHTGLFVEQAGANIVCLDANSDGRGTVRDETSCRWPTSQIAGCLKKK